MKTYVIEYALDGKTWRTTVEAWSHGNALHVFDREHPGANIVSCELQESAVEP